MLLTVDVGNSHIVLGVFKNDTLLGSWRLQSDPKRTVDEYALETIALINQGLRDFSEVKAKFSRIVIASVVPALSRVFAKLSTKYFNLEPLFVSSELDLGIRLDVDDPRTVGADRIVNALAASTLYGGPALVIDFGTATTFDIVNKEGNYQGGIIVPGVLIASEALFNKAALLHTIEIAKAPRVLGKNTRDSMLSGIYFGYVSLIEGLIRRTINELAYTPKIISTGGLASLFQAEQGLIGTVVPDLTLQGLKLVADRCHER